MIRLDFPYFSVVVEAERSIGAGKQSAKPLVSQGRQRSPRKGITSLWHPVSIWFTFEGYLDMLEALGGGNFVVSLRLRGVSRSLRGFFRDSDCRSE